jgi:hypothetical protein
MSKRTSLVVLALIIPLAFMLSCSEDETTGPEGESFGMGDAIAVVIDSILDDEVPAGSQYRCIRMSNSLPEGSVIEEGAPHQLPLAGVEQTSTVAMEAIEESYFFLLDLAPATFYTHPVKYILVDKNSNITVAPAGWWPVINGETPEQFLVAEPDEAFIIASNVNIKTNPSLPPEYYYGPIAKQYKEGFIVVEGLMRTEALYSDAYNTYTNGMNFFEAYKGSEDILTGIVESTADEVLDKIDYQAGEGVDVITIYIIAHGGTNSVSLGGYSFTANSFAAKMGEYPGVLFNFLLGSCHSGSFIDNLSPLSNVRVVLTACASDEGAKPDWDEAAGLTDFNTEDIGSEWTSSLLGAADVIRDDPTAWTQILTWASMEGVPPTCMYLYQAGWAALGEDDELGTFDNIDLSNRTGHTTPGFYCSW